LENYFFERTGQILLGISTLALYFIDASFEIQQQEKLEEKIERAEKDIKENPDKAKPLWDLANNRLELYFQRNLSQIKSIFWVTIAVMAAGFVLIGYGVAMRLRTKN
jgi:lipid II:glycine glycyltransferase (peptidoglycan interpeptide bridge formation enzyme)